MKILKLLIHILPPLGAVLILATLYYFFIFNKTEVQQPIISDLLPAPSPQVIEPPPLIVSRETVSNPQGIEHPTPVKSLSQPVSQSPTLPVTLQVATSTTAEAVPPKSKKRIHYILVEKNKFVPNDITINLGDVITWINNDDELHWPSSDPHPTHTGLIDFDVGSDLASGETYSYTFNRLGNFAYHDHTAAVVDDEATMIGVVRVIALPK